MNPRLGHERYLVRRKIFTLLGAAFHGYAPDGSLAFYSRQKAFKLKEDIRLYADESMAEELLVIQARQVIDFSAAYDVVDPATGEKVGALRRKGMKSILKDEWLFLDTADRELGLLAEDSMAMALVRRFLPLAHLIPQTYLGEVGGARVCAFRQNFNPFVLKLTLDFTPDQEGRLDRRLGLAAAVLLCAIEGRQD